MKRAAVRHGGENASTGCEPARRAPDDVDRIFDVLQDVAEHDVVETPRRRELLEERMDDVHGRQARRDRIAKRPAAFDDRERLAGLRQKLGHHALRRSHFEDRRSAKMTLEDPERIPDGVHVHAGRVERLPGDAFEAFELRAHLALINSTSNRLGSITKAILRPANATAGTGATTSFARRLRIASIACRSSGATYARW